MTEEERQAWNAAVASGDEETVQRLQEDHLRVIHSRIQQQDLQDQIGRCRP